MLGADGHPGARLLAVLDRMRDADVPLVLATGRPPRWILPVCDAIGQRGLCVAANGAVLWDAGTDRVLEAAEFPRDTLRRGASSGCGWPCPGRGLAVERVPRPGVAEFCCEPGFEHAWPNADHVEVPAAELTAAARDEGASRGARA